VFVRGVFELSQIQLIKRGCVGCKKPIEVPDLHHRFCQDCLIERTEEYRFTQNKNRHKKRRNRKELKYIRACVACNYIFLARYPKREYCSNSCLQRKHRKKVEEKSIVS